MSLAVHIFKKDIRHLRLLLAAWLAVLIVQSFLAVFAYTSPTTDRVLSGLLDSSSLLLPLLQFVLVLAIVPLVIQDEPLVGTTAFWFTRPVSRTTLLAAKSLFILLILILLPTVIDLFSLVAHGVIPRHLAAATPGILLEKTSAVLPLWVIAALTVSFARFAIVGGLSFVGFILIAAGMFTAKLLISEDLENNMVAEGQTTGVLSALIPILLAASVVSNQYLTRKTRRSVVILLSALFVLLVIDQVSSGARPFHIPAVDRAVVNPDQVRLSLDLKTVAASDAFGFRAQPPLRKDISAKIEVRGMPAGYIAQPTLTHASIEYSDGKKAAFDGYVQQRWGQWEIDALRHALGGAEVYRPEQPGESREPLYRLLRVDESLYRSHAQAAGTFTADILLSASRHVVVARLPVRQGAKFKKQSDYFLITDVLRDPDGVRLVVREGRLELQFADLKPEEGLRPGRIFVLLNSARNQAVLPTDEHRLMSLPLFPGFSIGKTSERFQVSSTVLVFRGLKRAEKPITVDDQWLAGAQLLRLETQDLGGFSKSLRVADFRMKPE
ncbi:MAG: hypothetical protein EHM61_04265 [Acidobacteria bacterium]|nr:MAG: hypothetical protein EHM61_04265 [Acidobacteriota bacterium]